MRKVAALLLCLCAAAPVAAQGPPDSDSLRWSIGLGVISSPRPYVGADNNTRLIPVLDLDYKRLYVRGILAGLRMVEKDRFELDLIGRGQFAGYEPEDSEFLVGMEERQETFEMGLSASWKLGRFEIGTRALADALGRSDGLQAGVDLTWNKVFGRGTAGLFPSIGVVWQSDDFVNYYAGVLPEEARPDRPAFEGEAALNFGAGLRGFSKLSPRTTLVWQVRTQRLANEYEESPIIDRRWTYFGLLGLTYGF